MTLFWIGICVLLFMVALVLLWPVLQGSKRRNSKLNSANSFQDQQQQAHLKKLRKQISRLEQELANGTIQAKAYNEQKTKLEQQLEASIRVQPQEEQQPGRRFAVGMLLGVSALVVVIGVIIYERLNDLQQVDLSQPPEFIVQLSLSSAAAQQVNPEATIFVFAGRPDGSGPPLAAARLQVKNLPTSISLSDANALMPQNSISTTDQVVIQARIALSGTPQAQPGDWQGSSRTLRVGGRQQLKLQIDQQL